MKWVLIIYFSVYAEGSMMTEFVEYDTRHDCQGALTEWADQLLPKGIKWTGICLKKLTTDRVEVQDE